MKPWAFLALVFPGAVQAQAVIVTHMLKADSVIGAADVTLVDADIPGALTTLEAAMGQQVQQAIYPGRPVLAANLGAPVLIQRNQTVALVYQAGPLAILAQGRALSEGAVGDAIKVMNTGSRATVLGTVEPDGSVRISRKE